MSKIITFLFLLFALPVISQVTVRSYSAEFYSKSPYTGNWVLEKSNKNIDISIVLFEDEILIRAESPSRFRFNKENATEISSDNMSGSRFFGTELYSNKRCIIEVVNLINTNYFVISIIYESEGMNFRYFINSDN